jgi:hypothetical protein
MWALSAHQQCLDKALKGLYFVTGKISNVKKKKKNSIWCFFGEVQWFSWFPVVVVFSGKFLDDLWLLVVFFVFFVNF